MLGSMKKAAVVLLLLLIPLAGLAREADGPRQNLWVELRWVESRLTGAALAAVQGGAVVVGTAGTVTSSGGVGLSTQRREDERPPTQRLLVLNGATARVKLTERTPIQWVDYTAQVDPNSASAGAAGTAGSNANASSKVFAAPRSGMVEQTQGFTVTPHWPGGRQSVRVELQAQAPRIAATAGLSGAGAAGEQASSQLSTQTVVLLPLGQWQTVARSGSTPQRSEPGLLSSRDTESHSLRELQIRVELAP
jgi:hypothetical protein